MKQNKRPPSLKKLRKKLAIMQIRQKVREFKKRHKISPSKEMVKNWMKELLS